MEGRYSRNSGYCSNRFGICYDCYCLYEKNAVRAVSLLVIVLSLAMWIIAPDIEAGKYSGIN
jgi:hypothetical protein